MRKKKEEGLEKEIGQILKRLVKGFGLYLKGYQRN